MNQKVLLFLFIIALLVGVYVLFNLSKQVDSITPQQAQTQTSQGSVLGVRTKTQGCQASNDLPDTDCTPGAVLPNATVDQICQPGYSKGVRNVTVAEKDEVYREYGVISHTTGEYEIDHLISLELGGSNDISNLWPEAADPRPGFHEKDKVEDYLHQQVCSGKMSLEQAQQGIAKNWLQYK